MNLNHAYTEILTTGDTSLFNIGFDFYESTDGLNVFIDGTDISTTHTVALTNPTTLQITPVVPTGKRVRIERETDIDQAKFKFTAGAEFDAQHVDANFEQIRHSQQEVKDAFQKLADATYPLVEGIETALERAETQANAASASADAAAASAASAEAKADGFEDALSLISNQAAVNTDVQNSLADRYTKAETATLLATKVGASEVYLRSQTYTKVETDTLLTTKVSATDVYPRSQTYTQTEVNTLVSSVAGGYVKAVPLKTDLLTIPTPTNGQVAKVMSDPVKANNGDYYYVTATSTWVQGYSAYQDAVNTAAASRYAVESSRQHNPNLFTDKQSSFSVLATETVGTHTKVLRNSKNFLFMKASADAGAIISKWHFSPNLFTTGTISMSVLIEGLTAGSNGLIGIQFYKADGTLISGTYAATTISEAVTSKVYTVTHTGAVPALTATVRFAVHFMSTSGLRECYVSDVYLSTGTNTEYVASHINTDVLANTAAISTLNSAFNEYPTVNLYDQSKAQDGVILAYATGSTAAFANGASLGKQAVTAGTTYTWTLPNTGVFTFNHVLYTYDDTGVYLGLDHSVGGVGEIVNATPPTGIVYSNGNRTVTFTIPVGSLIRFVALMITYVAHTTDQFVHATTYSQLEVGTTATAWNPPSPTGKYLVVKPLSLPTTTTPTPTASSGNTFVLVMDSTDVYIRTKMGNALDLVQQVKYNNNDAWTNNVVNPYSVRAIPSSTAKDATIAAFGTGEIIISQGDDAAPLYYNGTYIGANHGAFVVHSVTATAHGKVFADVGSTFTVDGITYTLIRVVNANTLWLLSDNSGTSTWAFNTASLTGKVLTRVAGGSATSITVTTDVLTQLIAAINNHTKRVIVDGYRELTLAGVYDVESVSLEEAYDIYRPTALLTYLQGRVGTATEQVFKVNSLASDMRVQVNYTYRVNGSHTVQTNLRFHNDLNFKFSGGTQAAPMTYGGAKTLFQYVPKLNPVVVGAKTWNLSAVEDITTDIAQVDFLRSSWSDVNNPPDKMVQIVKQSGVSRFGHVLGYSLVRGGTKPTVRSGIDNAGFLYTSRKMYPKAYSSTGLITAGTVYNSVAYRSVFDYSAVSDGTLFTWYQDNDTIYVLYDTHVAVSFKNLPLPSMFKGKSVTVVEKTASVTVHDEIVGVDGVTVSSTGYGYMTLALK